MANRQSEQSKQRWDADQAQQILDELDASGQSLTDFARRRGLVPQRLRWWQRHLAPQRGAEPAGLGATFIPVHVRAAALPATATLRVCGELQVELSTLDEATAAWVACLARKLGGAA